MMQGDECYLAIRILNNAGSPVSPGDIRDLEITLGHLRKTHRQAQVLYEDGLWLFPLSQDETLDFWPAQVKAQIRVCWSNGVVEGKTLSGVRIHESMSKEVL